MPTKIEAVNGAPQGQVMAIDAMPLLQRDPSNIWARAAEMRDDIYSMVEASCRDLGIKALVNKSIDFVYPAWVSLEAWFPTGSPGATRRCFGTILIEPKPYSKYEFEVTIQSDRSGKKEQFGPFAPLSQADIAAWVRYFFVRTAQPQSQSPVGPLGRLRQALAAIWVGYTLDRKAQPQWRATRIRKRESDFLAEKNEVARLKDRDPIKTAAVVCFVLAVFLFLMQLPDVLSMIAVAVGGVFAFLAWSSQPNRCQCRTSRLRTANPEARRQLVDNGE